MSHTEAIDGDGRTSRHRYPSETLIGDYLRAAFGLLVTAGPLLLVDLAGFMVAVFAPLALLFAWFGVRTGLRQMSWVELSPDAIALCGPLDRRLPWRHLERVKLAYYAPRRSREGGWLQLTLRGGGGRPIRLDSNLEDFDRILASVRSAAAARDLPLDPTTASNLEALDQEPGPAARERGRV